MDVREDGPIGIYDFGVSCHSHVRLGITDRLAIRRFQAKTQPDKMIRGERSCAALPNHFVAIRQNRGGGFWLVGYHYQYCAAVGIAIVVSSGEGGGKRRRRGSGIIAGQRGT